VTVPHGIELRPARPEELAAVRDLLVSAGLPLDGLEDAALLLVAVRGAAVVGCAALERHGADGNAVQLLRSVAVREDLRGAGLGAALTERILAEADARKEPVALLTETAPGYFPRFGFRPVPRAALPVALFASKELQGACPATARAFLHPASGGPGASPRLGVRAR
jgi:amino-acid N-acetyltransferase